jgi:hypothetical protein
MPRYTIDRFEGPEWIVLEDDQGRTFRVPRKWLPDAAREGDVIDVSEQQEAPDALSLRLTIDAAAREQRLSDANRLRERLPRGPKGDISL